jgi:hypothetical protein
MWSGMGALVARRRVEGGGNGGRTAGERRRREKEREKEEERTNGDGAKKRGGGGRQAVSSCLAARWTPSLQPRPSAPEPTWSWSKLIDAQGHSTRFRDSSPMWWLCCMFTP